MPATHSTLVTQYKRAAPKWQQTIANLGYPAAYADLVQHADSTRSALDVGTGTGALAHAYARAHRPKTMTLLDPAEPMLDIATDTLKLLCTITPLAASIGTGAVPKNSQSTVLAAHVIEHTDAPMDALHWMFERLKPRGQIILAVSKPHWCTTLVRWRWGHSAFRPEAVLDMLTTAGFATPTAHPFSKGPPSRLSCGYIARRP